MNANVDALPFNFIFDPARTALIIIDMQRDFIERGGFGDALGNDVSRLERIIPVVSELLEVCRDEAMMVVHTREAHRPDLSDCPPSKRLRGAPRLRIGDPGPMGRVLIAGEPGNDIIPELRPRCRELVLDKPGKGAFYATPLERELRAAGITHLILSGATTELCVQTTMREANDRGFECLLIEDATESYFPEFKAATLRMISAQGGIVGWVAQFADLVQALDHPERVSADATNSVAA
jgi:nicotinamidase-related amidase